MLSLELKRTGYKTLYSNIDANYEDWKKLLANKIIIKTFGKMEGEQVGAAPRGYAKDNPAIDLLRYKQFIFKHEFTDKEVLSPDFVFKVNDTFKKIRPFFNYMSEVLTSDANGVSVL